MPSLRILAAACLTAGLTACGEPPKTHETGSTVAAAVPASALDSARQFAQAFYDWYVPLADRLPESRYDSVLIARGSVFAPALLAALRDDLDAQRHAQDIVSVSGDYDPYLNTQDPCTRYEVRDGVPYRGGYALSLYGLCAGDSASLAALVDVERSGSAWVVTNIRIPDQPQHDLVSQLRSIKAQRPSPTSARRNP